MDADAPRGTRFGQRVELVVAIMLGVVSVATAYASFQASLYDSNTTKLYSQSQDLSTEAESLYLEANQQYYQDLGVIDEIDDLRFDIANGVPLAQERLAEVFDRKVYPELADAIAWADEQNAADPDLYTFALDDEPYLDSLYAEYYERSQQSDDLFAEGDVANAYGDLLTLFTVLLALALFLLGITAVLRQPRVQLLLLGIAGAGFVVAVVSMLVLVPFVPIG